MVEVLREHGGGWMGRDEIAREIARRDFFRRPSDGAHPPSDQLRLRARKPEYQHLFECSDVGCTRIRLRDGAQIASGKPARKQSAVSAPSEPLSARDTAATTREPGSDDAVAWYEELREQHRPSRLRVLLIAESPPDPGSGERRFFYSPALTIDNLYRGVAEAVYGERGDVNLRDKPAVLERLKEDGFWLIDAAKHPINKETPAARAREIAAAVPRLVERCLELVPETGVIVCHAKVYAAAAAALREAGVNVLHDESIPFPLGNWRAQFVSRFRRALGAAE